MATFGQGINPQLGAIDYSPILRGSVAGAQMAAQGGSMIGQGLANLGQEVGKGMQIYYKKKEEKKLLDDGINTLQNLYTKSPELFANIIQDPNDRGAWGALIKTVGGPAQVMQIATAITAGIDERGGQELAALYGSQGTTEISPEDGTPYSAKARLLGTNQFMQQQLNAATLEKTKSEIELNRANAGAKSPVGKIMSEAEFKALDTNKYDVKAKLLPDGRYLVESISPFGPGTQNVINMGEKAYEKGIGEAAAAQHMGEYAAAIAAPEALAKLDEVQGLIKSGNVTTGIGAELIQNANRLRAQFANDIKAGKTVSNTQLLDSLLGSDVFPMIGALGIGAKGMDTPAEREFLRQSFTGTKEFTPETLSRLTEIRRNMHLRAVDKFQKSNEKGTYKRFFDISGNPVPDFSGIPPIKGLNGEPLDIPYQTWQNMPEERRKLFRK